MKKITPDGLGVEAPFGLLPTTAYGFSLLLFVVATLILLPAILIIVKHKIKDEKVFSLPVIGLLTSGVLCVLGGFFLQP